MKNNDTRLPSAASVQALIPYGRQNAISRAELAKKMGLNDRGMRKAIELARAEGVLILNDQDGRGYFLSDDIADLKRQYKADTRRAMSILTRRAPLRDALKAAGEEV